MIFPKELIPVLGPVLGALIAASVAFLASVLSKESKTSELRQAWIDHLRNDLADFVGTYTVITDMAGSPFILDDDLNAWARSVKSEMLQLESERARILLSLNPDEHSELISKIGVLVSPEVLRGDENERDEMLDAFVAESQAMLRHEWRRVKQGERIYRFTKWVSLGVVALLVVAAVTLVTLYIA